MLGQSNLIAFAATQRPEESRRFYGTTLGLTLVSDEEHAIVFDAGGTMLRIQKAAEVIPPPYTILGWRVDEIEPAMKQLAARGVTFERYPFFEQDPLGVWSPDGATRICWFKDPDGNTLSLTQFAG
jgi:catechol 2,3-dioxygenase-like lactoylglutathione lyase family enzyme